MSNVLLFRPREALDAVQNLSDFLELCKPDVGLLTGDSFDSNSWDVSGTFHTPGSKHKQFMHFCSWQTAKSRAARKPMVAPYVDFAKAYTIYVQSREQLNSFGPRLTALRALHDVLLKNGQTCITELGAVHLDQTCAALKERLAPDTAYSAAVYLERLNMFVVEHRISPRSSPWRQWLPRPGNTKAKVGTEFDKRRQAKIPSQAAFGAIGSIFSIAVDTPDILVTGVCALLCGAPSRISEVLRLPVDCTVHQRAPGGLEVLNLRWWPTKGAPPMLKPVVSSMRDTVEEALSRLKRITSDGRKLARWYTRNPGRIYLGDELEHLRSKELLSLREVDAVVYGDGAYDASRPNQFCVLAGVPMVQSMHNSRLKNFVRFEYLEAAILNMLPADFPVADKKTGLLYEDSLFVLANLESPALTGRYRCMFDPVEQHHIAGRLGKRNTLSIFVKHGFKEDDGSDISLHTHQFRHYLNTLAQGAHLDQLDIARWSGRRNVSQNRAYDHTSGRDLLEQVRQAVTGEDTGFGPLARLHKVTLMKRDEFARRHIPTAHTTDFGHCVHDFTMLPCQLHQDCVNCNESVCLKGDEVRERNIRQAREEARLLMERAEAAQMDGEVGADRWLAHQKLTFERLDNLCRIFDDPDVPIGSVIQLSGIVPSSRLAQAAELRLESDVAVDTRKTA